MGFAMNDEQRRAWEQEKAEKAAEEGRATLYDVDDKLVELAQLTYAIARGSQKQQLDLYVLHWDELQDEHRDLYFRLVRAGYEAAEKR